MRIHETLALVIFSVGCITKVVKMPGHTLLIALGIAYWLIMHIIGVLQQRDRQHKWRTAYHFVGVASGLWMAYLLTVVKFMSAQSVVLGSASIISIGAMAYAISFKQKLKLQVALFSFIVLLATLLNLTPKHHLYYALNVKYNQEIHQDFRSLDKYSWFLTNAKEYDQALRANARAQKAVKKAINKKDKIMHVIKKLQKHQQQIMEKDWKRYSSPI